MDLSLLDVLIESIVVVVATFLVIQGFSVLIRGVSKRAGAKPSTLSTIREVMRLIWILVAVTGVLYVTGLTSEFTTLTISGIAGVAVSLALQSTLSNVISGILMFRDKVVRLDDEIQFGGVRGRVVRLALRSTWIRTQDGSLAVVGNSNLMSGPLVNYTAGSRLKDQWEEEKPAPPA